MACVGVGGVATDTEIEKYGADRILTSGCHVLPKAVILRPIIGR